MHERTHIANHPKAEQILPAGGGTGRSKASTATAASIAEGHLLAPIRLAIILLEDL